MKKKEFLRLRERVDEELDEASCSISYIANIALESMTRIEELYSAIEVAQECLVHYAMTDKDAFGGRAEEALAKIDRIIKDLE